MKILPLAAAVAMLLAPALAAAQESHPAEPKALQLRPKAVMESPPALQRAPFLAQPGEPVLDFVPRAEDDRMKASRSSCDRAGQSLCYDSGSGKIVYKKTREYMPELPGMRAEHISVKRDRVTFKYSF